MWAAGVVVVGEKQIPFGNDRKKGKGKGKKQVLGLPRRMARVRGGEGWELVWGGAKKQIPFGNDRKKGKGKSKSKGKGKSKSKGKGKGKGKKQIPFGNDRKEGNDKGTAYGEGEQGWCGGKDAGQEINGGVGCRWVGRDILVET